MLIIELVIALALWFITGHAIQKIYSKAGFIDTPKFVFWLPGLNLIFMLYLAFVEWPAFKKEIS